MNKILAILSLLNLSLLYSDNWNGNEYLNNSSIQRSHTELMLQSLELAGNERVVDVGCGDGRVTEQLAKRLPQGFVVGIDPSLSMIEQANKRVGPNFRFMQQAAETFSLDERFDHAISIHVQHWIKEQQQALKNIHKHLAPNGKLHIVMAPSKEGLPFDRALRKTIHAWSDHFTHFENPQQVYDIETYRQHLVAAGFHVDSIHYIYHKTTHANKEAFINWVRQWLPYAKILPQEQQNAFLAEFFNNYLIETGEKYSEEKPIAYGEYVFIAHATKIEVDN